MFFKDYNKKEKRAVLVFLVFALSITLTGLIIFLSSSVNDALLGYVSVIKGRPLDSLKNGIPVSQVWKSYLKSVSIVLVLSGIILSGFSLFYKKIVQYIKSPDSLFSRIPVFYIAIIVFALSLNIFYHHHYIHGSKFHDTNTIPVLSPIGADYRVVYDQSDALKDGIEKYLEIKNFYPPLVTVLNLPFSFFKSDTAYRLYTIFLLICLFISIYLAILTGSEGGKQSLITAKITVITALVFSLFYHTYPVLFTLERGNCDTLAALFSVISIYAMIKNRMLISIITLTIAVHYKVYPLILFAFIFTRFGFKTILIFILTRSHLKIVLIE